MDYSKMLTDVEFTELDQFQKLRRSELEAIYSDYADVEVALEEASQEKIKEILARRPIIEEEPLVVDELKIKKDDFLKNIKEDEEKFYQKYKNRHIFENMSNYFIKGIENVDTLDKLNELKEEYENSITLKEKIIQRGLAVCDECNQKYIKTFGSKYGDVHFNQILDIYRDAFIKNYDANFLEILSYNFNLFVLIKYKEAFRRQITEALVDVNSSEEIKKYSNDMLNRMEKVSSLDEIEALITEFNNNMLIMKQEKILLNPGKDEIPVVNPTLAEKDDSKSNIPVVDLPTEIGGPLLVPEQPKSLIPTENLDEKQSEKTVETIDTEDEEKTVEELEKVNEPDAKDDETNTNELKTLEDDGIENTSEEKVIEPEVEESSKKKFKVVFRNCTYKIPGYGDLLVEEGTKIHGPLIDPVPLNQNGKPKKFTAKVFSGWVDEYGNPVNLNEPITRDMEIRATYRFDRKKALVMAAGAAVGTLAYVADLAIPVPVPVVSIAGSAGFGLATRAVSKNVANLDAVNKAQASAVTAVMEPPAELLENIQKTKKKSYWKTFCKTAATMCGISAAIHGIRELKAGGDTIGQSSTSTGNPVYKKGEFKGFELGENKVYRTAADSLNGTNGIRAYAPAFAGNKTYKAYYNGVSAVIKPGDSLQSILDAVGATNIEQVAVNVMNENGGYLTWASLADCVQGISRVR